MGDSTLNFLTMGTTPMLVLLPFLKKSLAFTIAMGMLETHFVTFV
jgi:hypothetical protein